MSELSSSTKSHVSHSAEEMTTAVEQALYRQDRLARVLNILVYAIAVTAALVFYNILIYPTIYRPAPVSFPMTNNDQLIPEPDLDKPNMPNNSLLNWVASVLMETMTLNFVNYNMVVGSAKSYFTTEGYEYFKTSVEESKIIDRVVKEKLVQQAIAIDAPQIIKEGTLAGRYLWRIKMPMEFRYKNVTTTVSDNYYLTILVMRVPNLQSPMGVAILKYELEKRTFTPSSSSAPPA